MLPSATEIVFALGLEEALCGVTFECDHPFEARRLPHVSGTALPSEGELTPAAIDAMVSSLVAEGESIYTLDDELIRQIDPDLILAQDLCRVCAVPSGEADQALEVIGCSAEVLSLDPHTLDEVIGCIGQVGAATGVEALAEELMEALRARVDAVRSRVAGVDHPRVLVLEWADPPFSAGHWVPDMVEAAGGISLLAAPGERSRRLTWNEVAEAAAEVVVFMPCGLGVEGAVEQSAPLLDRPELAAAQRFFAVDSSAYFSRPGPRVVDGVELLADLFHGSGQVAGGVRLR